LCEGTVTQKQGNRGCWPPFKYLLMSSLVPSSCTTPKDHVRTEHKGGDYISAESVRTDLRKGLNLVNTSADLLNAGSIERASGRMLLSSLTIEKQMYS
jgi:hypothetical protein